MVTEKLHRRKILYGCFSSLWLQLLIAIMKRYAERCALQLYRTSLCLIKDESILLNKKEVQIDNG